MALMSLRSRSYVKVTMVLMRSGHLYIQLYKITSTYYGKTNCNSPDGD